MDRVTPAFSGNIWTLLPLLFLGHLLLNRYQKHLNGIPGRFLASFTDVWRLFNSLSARPHEVQIELHREYNSKFVRIGPRTISVSDASLVSKIYGPESGFTKSEFYSIFRFPYKGRFYSGIFNTIDERYHSKIKKPIASVYSLASTVQFEARIDTTTTLFIERLDEFATSGKALDFGLWVSMFALDVTGEICFSKRMGFLDTASDVDGLISNIQNMLKLAGVVGQLSFLDKLLTKNWLSARLMATHPIVTFCVDRMRERDTRKGDPWEQAPEDVDFLTRCYETQRRFPAVVTDDIIRTYNVDNIIGGSDTLAISLSSASTFISPTLHGQIHCLATQIFYFLMKTPSCLAKLKAEIDSTRPSGLFSWKDVKSLSYLQACIKEAMRLYPVVALLLERVVGRGGVDLDGHFFPKGTVIGCNPWVVHRDREIYGPDVDCFRPERWHEASADQLRAMERANLSFGSGSRICLGKHISMVEMTKLVAELLRRYEFRFVDEERVEIEGGWFARLKGFEVFLARRRD